MDNAEIVRAIADKRVEIARLKAEIEELKGKLPAFCKIGDVLTLKNGRTVRITQLAFDDDGTLNGFGGVKGVNIKKDGTDGEKRSVYKWDVPEWPKEAWER